MLILILPLFGFEQTDLKVGDKAPEFSTLGSDGKTHTLSALSKGGPVLLYFIKIGCPVNHRAIPYFEKLRKAYQGKATIVGVIDGSAADAKEWLKTYKSDMRLLLDPDLKIVRSYDAQYSPWAVAVDKGKVSNIFEGGSPKLLQQMNTFMATAAKMPREKLDFAGAPSGGG